MGGWDFMIKTALVLLWLALTGSYAGWQQSWLVLVNCLAGAGLLLWLIRPGRSRRRSSAISMWITAIVGAMVISMIVNGSWPYGFLRIVTWLGYLAIFYLAPGLKMHRAALLALFIYAPLALLGVFNANVVAFNLVSLGLLAIPVVENFGARPVIGLVAGLTIGLIGMGSFGGLLALAVAVSVYLFRNGLINYKMACCSPLVALLAVWFSPHSVLYRLQFWRDAWQGFLTHSLFGIGPGMYWFINGWPHAHNFFTHNLVELGAVGLACSFGLAFATVKEFSRLPTWAAALVAAVGSWSLVDLPTFFWGPGAVLFLSLGTLGGDQ